MTKDSNRIKAYYDDKLGKVTLETNLYFTNLTMKEARVLGNRLLALTNRPAVPREAVKKFIEK